MSITLADKRSPDNDRVGARPIVYRTRGRGYGEVFRLIAPNDLGRRLKPFVLLDSFAGDMTEFAEAEGLTAHSGIEIITVLTQGDARVADPQAQPRHLGYGGAASLRTGGGVWHGKELCSGRSERVHGFRLWLALPPELELSQARSLYVEAQEMPKIGPAHVIIGTHQKAVSPIEAPSGVVLLLVTIAPGASWVYDPPAAHAVAWLAVSRGGLQGAAKAVCGELIVFSDGEAPIALQAGSRGATLLLGSAVPHAHELYMGPRSIHTSSEALAAGELAIAARRRAPFKV